MARRRGILVSIRAFILPFILPLILPFLGVIGMTTAAIAAAQRADIPDRYKWNLADLYPSEAAWTAAKEAIQKRLPELDKHRGHLGKSSKELLAGLQVMFDLDRDLSRLLVYANSLSDQDVREARPRE